MKDSSFPSRGIDADDSTLHRSSKKAKTLITKSVIIHLHHFDFPLTSASTGTPLESVQLDSERVYTIGRTDGLCDFVFKSRLISKQHCQVLFDSCDRKIYILNGTFLPYCQNYVSTDHSSSDYVTEFRRRLLCCDELQGKGKVRVRVSLNGVFVNGVRVKKGTARELRAGDDVLLVCGNKSACGFGVHIGFLIQGVVFKEEGSNGRNSLFEPGLDLAGHSQGSVSSGRRNKRVFAIRGDKVMCQEERCGFPRGKHGGIVVRAELLSRRCREILCSDDPVLCVRQYNLLDYGREIGNAFDNKLQCASGVSLADKSKDPVGGKKQSSNCALGEEGIPGINLSNDQSVLNSRELGDVECDSAGGDHLSQKEIIMISSESDVMENNSHTSTLDFLGKDNACIGGIAQVNTLEKICPPPGKKFYLNRLHFMDRGSFSHQNVISLPELLHPVDSILQMFIATFTSDISWFLSHCEIPDHLPVTIACQDTERCWSSSSGRRTAMPYSDFPNLVVVFPPFPEAIAFGKDRKRRGIACHHPKLLVLQRGDSIRVIITSANLVPHQWNNVTNTVWWQDFPRRSAPDLSSLFIQVRDGERNNNSGSDFAAQLAGFMASLVIDVPSQAHWIIELTNYNFEGAMGYLVASVPGIHSFRPSSSELQSFKVKFLGSVEASVVGLSHLFHMNADKNGAQLKQLATYLRKSCGKSYGTVEVVLRRNTNILADVNAVSVLVSNPDTSSDDDCSQLGFLPRNVAKWVSPLWDSGFFRFSGYVYSEEALAAATGGSSIKLQLILRVSQGAHFSDMIRKMQPEHVIAFSTFFASIQRCTALWRLQEVLGKYKWPEAEESDFVYGSSSVGSLVNAQFRATFSAAVGKRSMELFDSEESDPEWGCWSSSQELRSPSMRIIFPTIERVKNANAGILSSRHILCFSEKTWKTLKTSNVLCDAVPNHHDRVGYPMHSKVAWRCFRSKSDASSLGWVYCGSHNFSAAAWGRPISNPFGRESNDGVKVVKPKNPLGLGLHVCNYEIGIIFVFPPTEGEGIADRDCSSLDDVVLPFFVPAPKYTRTDRPATKRAMGEALAELSDQERERLMSILQQPTDEIPDDDEEVSEATEYVVEEKEEEKAYAEMLWSQVDSTQRAVDHFTSNAIPT